MTTPEKKNGFGIASLCLAIPGLIVGMIPLLGIMAIILGALGLIFGLLGLGRVRRKTASNKWMSIIATVLSIASIALGVWGMVIVGQAVEEIDENINEMGQAVSGQFSSSYAVQY